MTTTSSPADPIVKRLQTVQHLIDSGKLPEAAERLQSTAKSAPGDPRVYLAGMRLAEAAGEPKRAEDAARRAMRLTPEWPVAVTELALFLARHNQFPEALALAEKAIALDGDSPDVLDRVIQIAQRAQAHELALQWMARAITVAPHTLVLRLHFAHTLRATGRYDEAIKTYDALLGAVPNEPQALLGRTQALLAMDRKAEAAIDAAALLALDGSNAEYRFWHDLARGEPPARLPIGMVRDLYENMAHTYDQHIVARLKYKLPREVARKIDELYPDHSLNVLDLGCGTGLLGVCMGRINGAMVGVEISPKMIEQAARHGVYDRFHNVDLLDALRETPASLYDVIAALDVFIYVGDLTAAIPNAYRVLRGGGHFIFSCETATEDEADLVLRSSQRYAHKASHIEQLCRAAGFGEVALEPMQLRYENMEPVQGFLVTARKPA
jgi:predicted TPR repeat methyltransferase/Tfp pilus assembly protein PilF